MIYSLRIIYWTLAGVISGIALFADAFEWILFPWPLALALQLLTNFAFGVAPGRQGRQRRLEDLKEFENHTDYPLAALEEVFQGEKARSGLSIPAQAAGEFEGKKTLRSILSDTPCLAFKIEVDIFKKTRFGGEADFQTLLEHPQWEDFELVQESRRLKIQGPRLLALGRREEKLLTWSTLQRSYPALHTLVQDHLHLSGRQASKFTGIRVREWVLLPGDEGRVFGQVQKEKDYLVIRGTDVLDDPESLLVFTPARGPRKPKTALPSAWWNLVLGLGALVVAAALFLAGPGHKLLAGIPGLGFVETGEVWVTIKDKRYGLEVFTQDGEGGVLRTSSDKTTVQVLGKKGRSGFRAQAQTQVKLHYKEDFVEVYRKGLQGYPEFSDGHWNFTPSGVNALEPKPGQNRTGALYLKNHTKMPIRIWLDSPQDRPLLSGYWTFNPLDGQEYSLGRHLVVGEENFNMSLGETLQVGDSLRKFRTFVVGVDPEIRWADQESAWVYDVRLEHLSPLEGELWVFNLKGQNMSVELPDPGDPQKVQLGRMKETEALKVWEPLKDDQGRVIKLLDGDKITLKAWRTGVLYQGTLKDLPQAKFDGKVWKVDL